MIFLFRQACTDFGSSGDVGPPSRVDRVDPEPSHCLQHRLLRMLKIQETNPESRRRTMIELVVAL